MEAIIQYIEANRDRYVEDLQEVLRIPSISSSPEHREEVRRCAELLADRMRAIGLTRAEVLPTGGHPVAYGEWLGAQGRPTVLLYGHYDVQPVDPLEEWESPPFDPQVRRGELYARGAADDKGQVYIHLSALEAHLRQTGSLPINVKVLVEGEEEIGSPNLEGFLQAERGRLSADLAIISDTPMLGRGLPSICYGLRGLCYLQLEIEGPSHDLHSGSFGGAVANPVNVLAEILAALKDPQGRITIPGFYDDVRPLSEEERQALASLPFDEEAFRRTAGVPALPGEAGYTTLERIWARPTLDLNGILGGFTGEGSKTIIPARAMAKVSMRLVPDQDPERIADRVEAHLRRLCPPSVRLTIKRMHGGKPFLAPLDHPALAAASRALEGAFGQRVCFIREGGSIPFVPTIAEALGCPCLLLGFGLPDENAHAPNEKLDLENYQKGIQAVARLYGDLATLPMSR